MRDIDAAEQINIRVRSLRKILDDKYILDRDYIKKSDKTKYNLSLNCFEQVALNSNTPEADIIKHNYTMMRDYLSEYQALIYQSACKNKRLNNLDETSNMFLFIVDSRYPDIMSKKDSKSIIRLVKRYNTGLINSKELKYMNVTCDKKLIKKLLQEKKDDDLFMIDKDIINDILDEYDNKKISKNIKQYDLISDLADHSCKNKYLKIYAYISNKQFLLKYNLVIQ